MVDYRSSNCPFNANRAKMQIFQVIWLLMFLYWLTTIIQSICIINSSGNRMFTQQDLVSLKKVKNQYLQKRTDQSRQSSLQEDKFEDELYLNKYFLNASFKILHIQIVAIQQVALSIARSESYMIYIIKVLTQDFSYDVKKRYSQFLRLYQKLMTYSAYKNKADRPGQKEKLNFQNKVIANYNFPIKRLSSSLRNFFKLSSKQELAKQRKSQLSFFLNQIKSNYSRFGDLYTDDYIELLKFINLKQQHQNYWRRKQGHLLQLSNLALKDTNIQNQLKNKQTDQSPSQNQQINIEYLTQLLQHQMNKINLAISVRSSEKSSQNYFHNFEMQNDPVVTDQIIKNIDMIRNIVLELKRKVTYEHIRCILKGKDIKQPQFQNCSNEGKKGIIEYTLKYCQNQLVSIHILKIIVNTFLNSQFNYSCDSFMKVLVELEPSIFAINEQKQILALHNKQFRENYFKLFKIYECCNQMYGGQRKLQRTGEKITLKTMGLMLCNLYNEWIIKSQKNKDYRLKDEQKQWKISTQNQYYPCEQKYCSKICEQDLSREQQFKGSQESFSSIQCIPSKLKLQQKPKSIWEMRDYIKNSSSSLNLLNSYSDDNLFLTLQTQKNDNYFRYCLRAEVLNRSYKNCHEIMKEQKNWNQFLLATQSDIYSNTRKDFIKIPDKQEKMFRFVQQEQIQVDLSLFDKSKQLLEENQEIECQNFVHVGHQQDVNEDVSDQKNPKMSTQTMPSASGSCAHQHFPEFQSNESQKNHHPNTQLVSKLSHKFILTKSPPVQGFSNSYYQIVKVQKLQKTKKYLEPCLIEVELIFVNQATKKYFLSQIQGKTTFIFDSFKKIFEDKSMVHKQDIISE